MNRMTSPFFDVQIHNRCRLGLLALLGDHQHAATPKIMTPEVVRLCATAGVRFRHKGVLCAATISSHVLPS